MSCYAVSFCIFIFTLSTNVLIIINRDICNVVCSLLSYFFRIDLYNHGTFYVSCVRALYVVPNLIFHVCRYGEFSSMFQDLCAVAQLHHTALRNARPPLSMYPLRPSTADEESTNAGGGELWWCPSIRPGSSHQGTPMSFCDTMTYHRGHYDILVMLQYLNLVFF